MQKPEQTTDPPDAIVKILAFAASNSRHSINAQLAHHAGALLADGLVPDTAAELDLLDLDDFEMPIYSVDREQADGVHPLAQAFHRRISDADAIIVSFAEHNGTYTAAFKNVLDWASRIDKKIWQGKPLLLLATSPGPGGAGSVLAAATSAAEFWGGDLRGALSVPSFGTAFDTDARELIDPDLRAALQEALTSLAATTSHDMSVAA